MEKHELKTGFKVFFWIFGIISLPLFLVGLLIIMLALKAHATVYEDRLEYWWLGRRQIPWDDISGISRAGASGGLLGAMLNPHSIQRATGKRPNIPIGAFRGSKELLASIRARAGLAEG